MRDVLRSIVVASAVAVVAAVGPGGAASGAPIDKTPTVTGTVARVAASERLVEVTLSDGTVQRFRWNAETKISGTLTPGVGVTVRYSPGAEGQNVALQITVSRN
jgi:YD repeat-containing protein